MPDHRQHRGLQIVDENLFAKQESLEKLKHVSVDYLLKRSEGIVVTSGSAILDEVNHWVDMVNALVMTDRQWTKEAWVISFFDEEQMV